MRWLLLCLALLLPPAAQAQSDAALLVADEVLLEGRDRLIARGNVEALYDGTRLTAGRIVYDRTSDTLTLDGPIRITDPAGNVVVAESGTLESNLENGLLRGARMVLDEQLQLASVQLERVGGRYTQLSKVAVTSCQVCGENGTPLWQIRARRVVHDQLERQIYFDDATLRVLNVPIFYLPRLRLPDPTLARARGFMIPSVRSTSQLGFGVKLPYFVPIGAHADLKFTPYLSVNTRTLETRYRQAFRTGDIEINTALSQDDLTDDNLRGYVFATGAFDLPRDFRLTFDVEMTTDEAFLDEYGYSGKDRLDSAVTITRTRANDFTSAGIIHYESLRDGEDNATQPTIIADTLYERRFFPARTGGEARLALATHGHFRTSTEDGPGRDVARMTLDTSWRKRWTLAGGLRGGVLLQNSVDAFRIRQDSLHEADVLDVTPAASVELRWPWAATDRAGARHLIEPLAQVGWVGGTDRDLANDESTRPEFDEGNLLSLARFPAPDARARGAMAALGMRWTRDAPQGWSTGVTLGRVWHEDVAADFPTSSGLDSRASDWLVAGHLTSANGLELVARGLVNEEARFSKAEARAAWSTSRLALGATYLLLVRDDDEDRDAGLSEWTFDGSYRFARHWTGSAAARYDLADDRLARSGLGLNYTNECIEIGLTATRKFASSSNLEPSTDYGLTVALKGFSTGGSAKEFRRTCSN